jgi:hypothetical protein
MRAPSSHLRYWDSRRSPPGTPSSPCRRGHSSREPAQGNNGRWGPRRRGVRRHRLELVLGHADRVGPPLPPTVVRPRGAVCHVAVRPDRYRFEEFLLCRRVVLRLFRNQARSDVSAHRIHLEHFSGLLARLRDASAHHRRRLHVVLQQRIARIDERRVECQCLLQLGLHVTRDARCPQHPGPSALGTKRHAKPQVMLGARSVDRFRFFEPFDGTTRLVLLEQETAQAVHRRVVVWGVRDLLLKLRAHRFILALGDQPLHRWYALSAKRRSRERCCGEEKDVYGSVPGHACSVSRACRVVQAAIAGVSGVVVSATPYGRRKQTVMTARIECMTAGCKES